MTPDEISREIVRLVDPYLRVERAPLEGWVRIWFGPHYWLDMDQDAFDRALQRAPLPVDAEGRIIQ